MASDRISEAERLYAEARAAAHAVMLDLDATDDQIEVAKAERHKMWIAYRDSILDDIRSRTALLGELLARLEAVRTGIQVNPVGDALDKVNGVIGAVNSALEAENAGDDGASASGEEPSPEGAEGEAAGGS